MLKTTVRELHDIESSLLDRDGSCRDLNFEAPTWAGVKVLLISLESDFGKVSGTDQEGNALTAPLRESAISATHKSGSAHLLFDTGSGLIKILQVFVSSEKDGSPFVEITFFPQDVEPTSSLQSDFIAWAQKIQMFLESRRCYARYENASWQFGDIGAQSGVFLVSEEITHS